MDWYSLTRGGGHNHCTINNGDATQPDELAATTFYSHTPEAEGTIANMEEEYPTGAPSKRLHHGDATNWTHLKLYNLD